MRINHLWCFNHESIILYLCFCILRIVVSFEGKYKLAFMMLKNILKFFHTLLLFNVIIK